MASWLLRLPKPTTTIRPSGRRAMSVAPSKLLP
jgi:hypothetical protein